ncbi:MAG: capsular polysaccharide biosynthesis protein [Pseudomonadota bacterium]
MAPMRGVDFLDSDGSDLSVGLCSLGLTRLAFLPAFLGLTKARFRYAFTGDPRDHDLFIGWGRKPSGQKAMRLAEAQGKPYVLLEDGFMRSVHPNSVQNAPALSLVVDDRGIFYDARGPSRLEDLISQGTQAKDGADIIHTLSQHRLSKYNDTRKPGPEELDSSGHVLVIDQTAGDLSIQGALADGHDFKAMLDAARDENPGAQIVVKSHPETVAGTRSGYLSDAKGCRILTAPLNAWDLFAKASRVYTVSSQLGFDALMAGKPVRCFGMPFYAGWGLSEDEKSCPRRTARPTLAQVAGAVYGTYCRYVDPYTASRTTFEQTAQTLMTLRDAARQGRDLGPFLNIYPWNRDATRAMFQLPDRGPRFFGSPKKAIAQARAEDTAITTWATRAQPRLAEACEAAGVDLFRVEDGFVRSVGLGSNFHQPMSLILDKTGIYYDSSRPSDLETLLANHTFDEAVLKRARELINWLISNDITKYNLSSAGTIGELPAGTPKILVPGQVEDDASVLHSGSALTSSTQLLSAVRAAHPDAVIMFKPHPDVVSGQRTGLWRTEDLDGLADLFLVDVPIVEAIAACDEVHVLSSLAGFEGLLRGKKVTCYGLPFYAGWDLTNDKLHCDRRGRKLTLEQLVAGSMILYPNYLDPVTQLPCGPETVIKRILESKAAPGRRSALVVSRELLAACRRTLRALKS